MFPESKYEELQTRCQQQEKLKVRVKRKNNTWCWMKASASPIKNPNGDVIGFQGMINDITERKITQDKLLHISKAVESASDAIGIADPTGVLTYHNPAFVEMFGYTVDELNTAGGPPVLYTNDIDAIQVFTTIQSGQSWRGEVSMVSKSGVILQVELKADVIKNEAGEIIGLIGIHTDITERKQAEAALQKSLKEVADIKFALDQSSIVAVTNHQGIIEYVNDKFSQISQYQPEEIIGKTHKIINSGHHTKDFFQDMWRTISQGKVWQGEVKNRTKYGRYYWVDTTIVPLLDSLGKPQQYVAIRNDITARKQAEVKLSKQAKELEQALKELQNTQSQLIQSEKMSSLGQLVAGIAHEINNPVNFIFGNLKYAYEYTQKLLKIINLYQIHYPEPVSEIQEVAENIDLEFLLEDLSKLYSSMTTGASRISEIVTSLRTFSRLDEADLKAADIHEGIDSTLMILEHRLKSKSDRHDILVIKEYGNLPLVECYAGQLNQVFMNILVNAIDALEENYRQENNHLLAPTIHIHTEMPTPKQVIIRIIDNGVGMSDEVRQKLFDPFYTTKPVGQGTGMGLSISYQIITNRHGGSLECISSLGKGSEFIIKIPTRLLKNS